MTPIRVIHNSTNGEAFLKYKENANFYLLKEDEYRKLQQLLNNIEGD